MQNQMSINILCAFRFFENRKQTESFIPHFSKNRKKKRAKTPFYYATLAR